MSVRRKKKGKKFDGPGPGSGMLPWCPPHPGGKPLHRQVWRMFVPDGGNGQDLPCRLRKDGNRKGEVTLWVVTVAGLQSLYAFGTCLPDCLSSLAHYLVLQGTGQGPGTGCQLTPAPAQPQAAGKGPDPCATPKKVRWLFRFKPCG